MKRLAIHDNKLELETGEMPVKTKANQVLVKVHAVGLNRADLLQTQGLYPSPDNSNVPGLELSGIRTDTGDAICALVSSGAFAEYIYLDPMQFLTVPQGLDLTAAAALPEALITCWLNLVELGGMAQGKNILIHGGSSGIGSFAIQLAKAYSCRVYATVGNSSKFDFCHMMGADQVFDYNQDVFVKEIKEQGGVDIVLDILAGEHLNQSISCLKTGGRLMLIAVMSGSEARVNAAAVLMKNLSIIGSTLRSKTIEQKHALIENAIKHVYPLIEAKKIKPAIDLIYNIEDFREAFARIQSRQHQGKILMQF
jgi:NADPH2:quinone reductase